MQKKGRQWRGMGSNIEKCLREMKKKKKIVIKLIRNMTWSRVLYYDSNKLYIKIMNFTKPVKIQILQNR
jgi:hypothetical protein